MKRIISLLTISALTATLLLTSCGGPNVTVADDEIMKNHPELEGVIYAWQGLVDAAAADDCETFIAGMRLSTQTDETACPEALEFLTNKEPEIDWAATQWSSTMGKAKIYNSHGGSVTGYILNEATDVWGADEKFWE